MAQIGGARWPKMTTFGPFFSRLANYEGKTVMEPKGRPNGRSTFRPIWPRIAGFPGKTVMRGHLGGAKSGPNDPFSDMPRGRKSHLFCPVRPKR